MAIWFTSDCHFHHANIIRMTDRPFSDCEEMDNALLYNWNSRVKPEDDIYILGDLAFAGAAEAAALLRRLNGRKYLVKGNHDRFADQASFPKELFVWIKDYHRLVANGRRIILFHYPIEEWDQFFRGAYHLHGHQHNLSEYNLKNRENGFRRYDVGVDANGYAPVKLEEIIAFFEKEV